MMKIFSSLVIAILLFVGCNGKKKQTNEAASVLSEVINTSPEDKNASVSDNVITAEASTENMVLIPAGKFVMGRNDGLPQEAPAHEVSVKAFYIDVNLVSVKDFRTFIKATQYVTEAERFNDSGVFDFEAGQWFLKPKTTWEYPLGPEADKAKDDHPVTHVSWRDALAYAKWAGKRLVTEQEWEYAARNGGKTISDYPWGTTAKINGKWRANVFQGSIQDYSVEDGYLYTSPIGAFGANDLGLNDICGNVWEWTADVYRPYPGNNTPFQEEMEVKATRGGSFMYDEAGEASYSVYFRSSNSSETSLFNTGFRCALSK